MSRWDGAIQQASGDPVQRGYGLLQGGSQSLTEGLLADRRWELQHEERGLPPRSREPRKRGAAI